jgi:hypothetical protein
MNRIVFADGWAVAIVIGMTALFRLPLNLFEKSICLLSLMGIASLALAAEEKKQVKEYSMGKESQRQEGVPRGTVITKTWKNKVFPNTIREYMIYVPAQYQQEGKDKAAVMVFQDGHAYVDEKGQVRATRRSGSAKWMASHYMPA